jgi:thioredoxin-dependent peroxiredoxin
LADFQKLGVRVVGISADDVQTLIDFQTKTPAPQQFVSDPDRKAINAYGVEIGVGTATLAKRQTFVIGKDGKILFTYFDWSPLTNVNKTLEWLQQHPQN